jgi:mannose-6-phosphate isomerase-like protein (cupin superfamily)
MSGRTQGITPPSQPRIQDEPWGRMAWLVEQRPGGPDPGLSVAVMTVKPGQATPRHRHGNCTEVLYVTGGRLRVRRGDEAFDCHAGDSVIIPEGCPHAAENPGSTEASALIAYSAGRRDYQLASSDDERPARSRACNPSR